MKPDADGLLRTQSQSVASFWSLAQNSTSESCYNDPRFRLADIQRIPHSQKWIESRGSKP